MPKRSPLPHSHSGFSLVELLVALVLTSLLMAGMAKVFQSSLSAFYTSADSLSSARRNRLSLDILQDDLNNASMYLVNVQTPPTLSTNNPGFFVIPNRPVQDDSGASVAAGGDLPTQTDEIYMYMDDPLPLDGTLQTRIAGQDEMIAAGTPLPATLQFDVQFPDPSVANKVSKGQYVIIKDWFRSKLILSVSVSGSTATISADPNPQATAPDSKASFYDRWPHLKGSQVTVVNRSQMVRYRIKAKKLDPDGSLVPCLVREELNYALGGNATDPNTIFPVGTADEIITENLSAFKVYLSGNSGATWAGVGLAAADYSSGWTNGIFKAYQNMVPNGAALANDPNWFRNAFCLVRVDLTTRTARKRAEYYSDGSQTANKVQGFKDQLHTFVIMPRHSGLPL